MMKKENKLKKRWERKLRFIMALCGALVIGSGIGAAAIRAEENAILSETEENDTQSTANALELNTTYRGNTSHKEDVDWYEFKIPEGAKGYLTATLQPDDKADTENLKWGWSMGIYQKRQSEAIISYKKITSKCVSQKMPLAPGEYCIRIGVEYSHEWTDENYNLRVDYVEDANWESEDLVNEPATADTIEMNRTYYGNLTDGNDKDWFEFTTTEYGKLVLNLEPDASENTDALKWGWNAKIYRSNDANEFEKLTKVTSPSKTYDMYLDAGKYRIKVEPNYSHECPSGLTYDLRADYEAGGNIEHEWNDTVETANQITTDVTYTGNMKTENDNNDNDYFVVTPAVTGTMILDFNREATSDPGNGYDIIILDSSNKELVQSKKMTEESVQLEPVTVMAGSRYYILIKNNYSYKPVAGVNYHFSLTVTEGVVPTASPTPTATPRPTITPKPTATVTPTQKPEQKVTVPSTSASDRVFTETKVSVDKVTTAKKKVYLKWKRNPYATGYKIYRSMKKKGKYRCIMTIKKSGKTSCYDKKVKKGKTYFYKIRAYKKSGRKTIYSGFSPIKRVKVK